MHIVHPLINQQQSNVIPIGTKTFGRNYPVGFVSGVFCISVLETI